MDDGNGSDTMADSLRQSGIFVVRAGLYRRYRTEQEIREAVLAVYERYRPDVVHVHCGSPRSAVLPRELAVNASLPLIVTENYVAADLEIPDDILQRIKQLYRRAFAVIAVCEENRVLLREKFGLRADQQVVIRYGIRLPPERSRNPVVTPGFKAITVARLTPQKGIDVLLRAVAALPVHVRSMFQFTVVGDGQDDQKLNRMAEDLYVAECMSFPGWSNDVQALLQTSDLFILPSRAEGQPIALLEALAAGLPCIASAVSGIPEALGDGKYGTLVRAEDPLSLSEAIASFAANPTVLRQKAAAARDYLRMNHDPERNMGEVVRLWKAAAEFQRG
jgi:glycosyltransferase involved in cell wall biosynthesis